LVCRIFFVEPVTQHLGSRIGRYFRFCVVGCGTRHGVFASASEVHQQVMTHPTLEFTCDWFAGPGYQVIDARFGDDDHGLITAKGVGIPDTFFIII